MTFMLWFYDLAGKIDYIHNLSDTSQDIDEGLMDIFDRWSGKKKVYYFKIQYIR
jgi:hypothetical protein